MKLGAHPVIDGIFCNLIKRFKIDKPRDFVLLVEFGFLLGFHVEDFVFESAAEGDQMRSRVVLVNPFLDFDEPVNKIGN